MTKEVSIIININIVNKLHDTLLFPKETQMNNNPWITIRVKIKENKKSIQLDLIVYTNPKRIHMQLKHTSTNTNQPRL